MEGSTVLYFSIDSASKVTVGSTPVAERRRSGRERQLEGRRCVHASPMCHACTPLSPARTDHHRVAPHDWSLAEHIGESNIIVMADVFGGLRVNVSESEGLGGAIGTTAKGFGKR